MECFTFFTLFNFFHNKKNSPVGPDGHCLALFFYNKKKPDDGVGITP
jgi:hypothetical protein